MKITLVSTCILAKLHCVSENWCWIFVITSANVNHVSKFIRRRKKDEISNKTFIKVLPYFKFVATLPCEMRYSLFLHCQYVSCRTERSADSSSFHHHHYHLILTHQTKQQYQNRLCIDTMCEWIKRPRSGTNNNPSKNLKI